MHGRTTPLKSLKPYWSSIRLGLGYPRLLSAVLLLNLAGALLQASVLSLITRIVEALEHGRNPFAALLPGLSPAGTFGLLVLLTLLAGAGGAWALYAALGFQRILGERYELDRGAPVLEAVYRSPVPRDLELLQLRFIARGDARALRLIFESVITALASGMQIVAVGVTLAAQDPLLTAVILALLAVYFRLTQGLSRELRRRTRSHEAARTRSNRHSAWLLKNLRPLQPAGEEEGRSRRIIDAFRDGLRPYFESASFFSMAKARTQLYQGLFNVAALTSILVFGGLGSLAGRGSWSTVLAYLVGLRMLFGPLERIMTRWAFSQPNAAKAERHLEFLRSCEEALREPPADWRPPTQSLDLSGVVPRPAAGPPPPRIEASLRPGRPLCIITSPRSPYSFIDLLLGRLPAREGTLTVNGELVLAAGKPWRFPRRTAYLSPESVLLPLSIRDNVCSRPEDEERLQDLARELGVHEAIAALPQGYDTVLTQETAADLPRTLRCAVGLLRELVDEERDVILVQHCLQALPPSLQAPLANVLRRRAPRSILVVEHTSSEPFGQVFPQADYALLLDGSWEGPGDRSWVRGREEARPELAAVRAAAEEFGDPDGDDDMEEEP